MGHFGFSWVGAAFLAALFVPNTIWALLPRPAGYDPSIEPPVLRALERIGQVATVAAALLFSDTNPAPWSAWSWWLVAAIALMALYEICWLRYFLGPRTLGGFTRGLGPVPVPLASLPVAAFLLLGVYGRLPWLIAAVLLLGVGHIGIHLLHRRASARAAAPPGSPPASPSP